MLNSSYPAPWGWFPMSPVKWMGFSQASLTICFTKLWCNYREKNNKTKISGGPRPRTLFWCFFGVSSHPNSQMIGWCVFQANFHSFLGFYNKTVENGWQNLRRRFLIVWRLDVSCQDSSMVSVWLGFFPWLVDTWLTSRGSPTVWLCSLSLSYKGTTVKGI